MRKTCVWFAYNLWTSGSTFPQYFSTNHNEWKTPSVVRSLSVTNTQGFAQSGRTINRSSVEVVHVFRRHNNKNNK